MHHQNKVGFFWKSGNFNEGSFGSGPPSLENSINIAVFGTWISVWVMCMYNNTVSTLKDFSLSIHVF